MNERLLIVLILISAVAAASPRAATAKDKVFTGSAFGFRLRYPDSMTGKTVEGKDNVPEVDVFFPDGCQNLETAECVARGGFELDIATKATMRERTGSKTCHEQVLRMAKEIPGASSPVPAGNRHLKGWTFHFTKPSGSLYDSHAWLEGRDVCYRFLWLSGTNAAARAYQSLAEITR